MRHFLTEIIDIPRLQKLANVFYAATGFPSTVVDRGDDDPGTGIGLAIVRKAMERIGGKVWAERAPGQGAVFTLEIPRLQA